MVDIDELRARVVGTPLPEGSFTIRPHEAWLAADALASPPLPEGVAHPMYVFYAGLVGMGVTLDDLFAMVDSSAEDGPLFGEMSVEQHRPLRVGETLAVRGEILEVVRKRGRSGVFDIVTFALTVVDAGGDVAGRVTNAFIFPRRG